MYRIRKRIGTLLMVILLADILIYAASVPLAEFIPNLHIKSEEGCVLYKINAAKINGGKRYNGILYIIEKEDAIVFRYARPVKTNYFMSNVWGDSVIYLLTEEQYSLNLVTKEITGIEGQYLEKYGTFLIYIDVPFHIFAGVTTQKEQLATLQLNFEKSFDYTDSGPIWVFAGTTEEALPGFLFRRF